MKPIEYCLDTVLQQLADNYADKDRPALNSKELLDDFEVPQGRDEFFKGLLNILIDDCYADFLDYVTDRKQQSIDIYRTRVIILPKGFYFLRDGGYSQKETDRLANLHLIDERFERTERNQERIVDWTRLLTKWTRLAAIGALGILVLTVIDYLIRFFGWLSQFCS